MMNFVQKLRGVAQGFVHMVKVVKPVRAAPVPNLLFTFARADGLGKYLRGKVAQNSLVYQSEEVKFEQCFNLAVLQVFFDAENFGVVVGEFAEGLLIMNVVAPAFEEDQRVLVKRGLFFEAEGVAGFEKRDGKVFHAEGGRLVAEMFF